MNLLLKLFPSIRKMKSDRDDSIASVLRLGTANGELKDKISKLEERMNVEKTAAEHWRKKSNEFERQARDARHENGELELKNSALNQRIVNQQSLIDGYRKDKESLLQRIASQKSLLDDYQSKDKERRREKGELQKENKALKEHMTAAGQKVLAKVQQRSTASGRKYMVILDRDGKVGWRTAVTSRDSVIQKNLDLLKGESGENDQD